MEVTEDTPEGFAAAAGGVVEVVEVVFTGPVAAELAAEAAFVIEVFALAAAAAAVCERTILNSRQTIYFAYLKINQYNHHIHMLE